MYVPIFRGLDASGGRKQRTNRHTHARTHAHTRDNYSNPRCAHARQGLIKHSDLCRGHSDLLVQVSRVVSIFGSSYNGLGSYTKKLRQTSVTISFQFCVDIIQFNYLFHMGGDQCQKYLFLVDVQTYFVGTFFMVIFLFERHFQI